MNRNMLWVAMKHYLKRTTRDFIGLGIFMVLPVVIVAILSFVYTQNNDGQVMVNGYNMVTTRLSVSMMLYFQLNCGLYLMNFLDHDFLNPMKWRLKASPVPPQTLIYAGVLVTTIYATLQGIAIALFTTVFMQAYWGNPVVVVIVVFLLSLFSQMMGIILLLVIRNLSAAEMINWAIAWSMAVLGGLMFDLPDTTLFNFMRRYGTPYSMAQTAIHESGFLSISGLPAMTVWMMIASLTAVTIVFGLIAIPLGRRKLL